MLISRIYILRSNNSFFWEVNMLKQTKHFLLSTFVIMLVFGFWVRLSYLAPVQATAGPVLESHGWDKDSCDICHRKLSDWHEEYFGYFDNCTMCHEGAIVTPHPISGSYSFCLGCHESITPSHDRMFPFEKASYQADCLGCHPAN